MNDIDHHTISLEPVKFSFDEDMNNNSSPRQPPVERREKRSDSYLSTESSDDEFFDAHDQPVARATPGATGGATLAPLAASSRSISVTTIEGDPPDVEEDRDFTETEELAG